MLVKDLYGVMSGEWVIEAEMDSVGYSIFMCDDWFSVCETAINELPPHLRKLVYSAIANSEVICVRTKEDWKPRVVINL